MTYSSILLWLIFVIYSLTYGLLFGLNSVLLPQLLQGQADGFSSFFFNWMGLVPFYFLVDASLDQDRPRRSWVPLGLGFFLGAYSTLWGYRKLTGKRKKLTLIKKIILISLLLTSAWLISDALINTDSSYYFSNFFQDSLVGIMTIDFLVLYLWSLVIAQSRYQSWWLAFIPMVGFGLLILFENKFTKPIG
jgi:hypothetical protein